MALTPYVTARLVDSAGNILPSAPLYFMIEQIVVVGHYGENMDAGPMMPPQGVLPNQINDFVPMTHPPSPILDHNEGNISSSDSEDIRDNRPNSTIRHRNSYVPIIDLTQEEDYPIIDLTEDSDFESEDENASDISDNESASDISDKGSASSVSDTGNASSISDNENDGSDNIRHNVDGRSNSPLEASISPGVGTSHNDYFPANLSFSESEESVLNTSGIDPREMYPPPFVPTSRVFTSNTRIVSINPHLQCLLNANNIPTCWFP